MREKFKSHNNRFHVEPSSSTQETNYSKLDRVFNEKCVTFYLNVEKNKKVFDETITEEYHEKVTLYGYLIVGFFLIFDF